MRLVLLVLVVASRKVQSSKGVHPELYILVLPYQGHKTEIKVSLPTFDILLHDPPPSSNQIALRHVSSIYRAAPITIQFVQSPVSMRLNKAHVVVVNLIFRVIWSCRASLACHLVIYPFEFFRVLQNTRAFIRWQSRTELNKAIKKSPRF